VHRGAERELVAAGLGGDRPELDRGVRAVDRERGRVARAAGLGAQPDRTGEPRAVARGGVELGRQPGAVAARPALLILARQRELAGDLARPRRRRVAALGLVRCLDPQRGAIDRPQPRPVRRRRCLTRELVDAGLGQRRDTAGRRRIACERALVERVVHRIIERHVRRARRRRGRQRDRRGQAASQLSSRARDARRYRIASIAAMSSADPRAPRPMIATTRSIATHTPVG
jgi:hypothetical protein